MGEVATISDAQMAELAKYSQYAVGGASSMTLPKLQLVNKETDPSFGKWMLGRKRNEDGTVEPGQLAKGLIVLYVRRQFSYMNMNPAIKNCWSQMYKDYPNADLVGSQYNGQQCITCPRRAKDRDPKDKCKCQIVVYGYAVLEDNSKVACVTYVSGSSYMPFQDYLQTIAHVTTEDGRFMDIAPFTFTTDLGAKKTVNGAVVYFTGAFRKGAMNNPALFPEMASKCEEITAFVKEQNANHGNKPTEPKTVQAPVQTPQQAPVQATGTDDGFGNVSGFPTEAGGIDDCPFDVTPDCVSAAGVNSGPVGVDDLEAMFESAGI